MSQSKRHWAAPTSRWVLGLYIMFSLGGLVAGCMTRSGDMPDRDAAAISQVMRGLNNTSPYGRSAPKEGEHDPKR